MGCERALSATFLPEVVTRRPDVAAQAQGVVAARQRHQIPNSHFDSSSLCKCFGAPPAVCTNAATIYFHYDVQAFMQIYVAPSPYTAFVVRGLIPFDPRLNH
jgi:hypothetical protein